MTSRAGVLLREMRRQTGLTQEQLAERSGVSVSTIRRLENGRPVDPRMGTVKLLADALGTTAAERRALLAEFGAAAEPAEAEPPRIRSALSDAADQFAQVVASRWQREEEQRRVHDPYPLPVRWQQASPNLTDRWDNIRGVRPGGSAEPLDLNGELDDIADVYRRIPSGRLAVLGRAGSGKTILTLRFVLGFLRTRTPAEPVPAIFTLSSWDPTASTLRNWLIERLPQDYPDCPGLTGPLAAELVETGCLLPVLDGFDELATGLHAAALAALSATSLPFLLTSRPAEYATAVAATDVPTSTAGVELLDLTPADVSGYLPRTTSRAGDRWDPVLAELRACPGGPLSTALRTPLMVALARTVYSAGRDPAVLLDTARFPTSHALEDHLLASFVPTVYEHRPPHAARPLRSWDPERAQRWLGYLAQHVGQLDEHDLAWWQLGASLRRSSRILAVVLASTLAIAVLNWLVFVPLDLVGRGTAFTFRAGLMDGLLIGPMVGLAFGLVHGLMIVCGGRGIEPSRVQIRLRGRHRTGRQFFRAYASRLGAALLGGFVIGLGYGPVNTALHGLLFGFPPDGKSLAEKMLVPTLVYGLIFGLAAGLVFGLMAALEIPLDVGTAATPLGLLATNRATALRQLLILVPAVALAIAFGGSLLVELLQGPLGPLRWPLSSGLLIGAVGGLGGGLSYVLAFTAWGQWVLLARIWLPLTGRLPWAVPAFLDDAYRRGVLRQAGAVYQFRHARLQDHLGRGYRAHR
ncbi:helix-turn-helix domain-containing protein [Amycolatopsis sp. FU40]|uniref:helix-turn-helix domain-containing protein n=1 Tax=Amycolatopsis sp. FU40 TaxID=2914159 RepID=UPI001F35498D|nr:helix-turn-helix domain-containing protein [Amycolatopsis sp. FU40]UKD59518.1 helix-turn-helix domain-containing protein [Amycolatopsis sp. FU40]